jgi:fibronectin type 3 domain-containing protein
VTLSGAGTHDVMLAWTAVTSANVAGYNIFRGTSPGGEGSTPLNSTPVQGTSYIDESVSAGVTYYYVITDVSQNGVTQSAPSNQVSAAVPSP